jgi:hypothetical protein
MGYAFLSRHLIKMFSQSEESKFVLGGESNPDVGWDNKDTHIVNSAPANNRKVDDGTLNFPVVYLEEDKMGDSDRDRSSCMYDCVRIGRNLSIRPSNGVVGGFLR